MGSGSWSSTNSSLVSLVSLPLPRLLEANLILFLDI